jgi:hypothetical protein
MTCGGRSSRERTRRDKALLENSFGIVESLKGVLKGLEELAVNSDRRVGSNQAQFVAITCETVRHKPLFFTKLSMFAAFLKRPRPCCQRY